MARCLIQEAMFNWEGREGPGPAPGNRDALNACELIQEAQGGAKS